MKKKQAAEPPNNTTKIRQTNDKNKKKAEKKQEKKKRRKRGKRGKATSARTPKQQNKAKHPHPKNQARSKTTMGKGFRS